jgi:hypothetical protein
MLRRSYTATLARGERWTGSVQTEPYECAWAGEAIFFVRALEAKGMLTKGAARVQISPDGIHWTDEGTRMKLPGAKGEVTFARVRDFGGYLRLAAELPRGTSLTVVVALALKE